MTLFNFRYFIAILFFCLATTEIGLAKSKVNQKPNVIIIFTDDLGYGDVGCYGAQGFQTPAIDKMADQGMKFTDFTVGHCICTPSRASILTGRHPERWGYKGGVYFPKDNDGMPSSEITIAEVLKEQGYNTGIIGKWHLGHKKEFLPLNQGFDFYFGIPYSNDMWQDGREAVSNNIIFNEGMTLADYQSYQGVNDKEIINKYRNKVPLMRGNDIIEWPVDQRTITKRYTEEAQQFIKSNTDKPFFLYLAHSMPHIPLYVSEKFKNKTKRGLYGDVIEEIDWSIGEVIKTLKESGLDENTLVVFTSDNGPWLSKKQNGGSAGELRGGKFTTYEGGQRVPCVMWWPQTIPAGKVCQQHISAFDLLPTIAELSDAALPEHQLDGIDVGNIIKGKTQKSPKRDFYIYGFGDAIRIGDWKYRKSDVAAIPKWKEEKTIEVQLFNLKEDPNEKNNLAKQYPEKVTEMAKRLEIEYGKIVKSN